MKPGKMVQKWFPTAQLAGWRRETADRIWAAQLCGAAERRDRPKKFPCPHCLVSPEQRQRNGDKGIEGRLMFSPLTAVVKILRLGTWTTERLIAWNNLPRAGCGE